MSYDNNDHENDDNAKDRVFECDDDDNDDDDGDDDDDFDYDDDDDADDADDDDDDDADDDDDEATPDRSVPVTASLNIHACPRSKLFPTKSSSSQSSA